MIRVFAACALAAVCAWPAFARPNPSEPGSCGVGVWGIEDQTFFYSNNNVTYEVSVRDGQVVSVKRNGESMPTDRVRVNKPDIIVVDDTGKEVARFTALLGMGQPPVEPVPPVAPTAPAPPKTPKPPTPTGWMTDKDIDRLRDMIAPMPGEPARKVMVGVQMVDLDPSLASHFGLKTNGGIMVSAVGKDLPADKAGLKPWDIILSINSTPASAPEALSKVLRTTEAKPGDKLTMSVIHAGQKKDVTIDLLAYDGERFLSTSWERIQKMSWDTPDAVEFEKLKAEIERMKAENEQLRNQLLQHGAVVKSSRDIATAIRSSNQQAKADAEKHAVSAIGQMGAAGGQQFIMLGGTGMKIEERLGALEGKMDNIEKMLREMLAKARGETPANPPPAEKPR